MIASARGESARQRGFRNHAAATNTAAENAQNIAAAVTETAPAGISRRAVRGFSASTFRSTIRLNAIATDRAPTMAARMPNSVRGGGTAPAASTVASSANGSAKTVCENVTRERNRLDRKSVV